ncbi:chaperone modulator CbpM [Geomonas sp. RF6]|uniref:chaperone modulator CbpM n=1 Tax=Geomonas sp. RF6 TaxID=2897342 RepID=UPI001E4A90C2|nr:chaperone modulator CbpM [Geomonas sp. RF6]UFS72520.1 chaperone modulator CbpM [Geomonas sp. RF6]
MPRTQYEVIIRTRNELASLPGIPLQELCRLCECQMPIMRRLVDTGLLEPISTRGEPLYATHCVIRARKALRLKRDLGLNFDALALVMELLDRIEDLERRLR